MPNFTPDEIHRQMSPLHKHNINMHVHCNGDMAVDLMLDGVERVLGELNWPDHRHTCTHSQLTRPDQYKRMARLGVCANIFTNHCYYWGDQHYEQVIGPRAINMWACRTALDTGVPGVSLHSDAGVTPVGHLHTMWCAVNRLTASGRVMGEHEKVTPMEALRMATINAAFEIHMDDKIGSIEPGKYADFAVLYENPLEVDPVKIKDIKVFGTILNGRKRLSSQTLAEIGLLKKGE
jgi:predicted amidohydrolase YtcJ